MGAIAIAVLLTPIAAHAVPIHRLEYTQGALSFADAVASYTVGPGVDTTHLTPANALGLPDSREAGSVSGQFFSDVSLGSTGEIVFQFTDNLLVNGSGFDLAIYETGAGPEWVEVAVSTDGVTFISLPGLQVNPATTTLSGEVYRDPVLIDIGSGSGIGLGEGFSYVRLRDAIGDLNPNFGISGGPDIDAVGAINSVVPEPSTALLVGTGLVGLAARRRRLH